MSTKLIKIISLSYNLYTRIRNFDINDGDFRIYYNNTKDNNFGGVIHITVNGEHLLSLLLEKIFKWGTFKVDHVDLLDLYDKDDAYIILILSKKVLNHNFMGDIDKETLEKYSKVIDILTRKLHSLK